MDTDTDVHSNIDYDICTYTCEQNEIKMIKTYIVEKHLHTKRRCECNPMECASASGYGRFYGEREAFSKPVSKRITTIIDGNDVI